MSGTASRVFARLAEAALTLAAAVVAGCVLICAAPGTGMDERELDLRLTEADRDRIRAERDAERRFTVFLPRYLAALARGDLGVSESFNRPVAELLGERFPVTLRTAGGGLAAAWVAAGVLTAAAGRGRRGRWFGYLARAASGSLLCIPAALTGLLLVVWQLPVWLGIAVVVFPKVFGPLDGVLSGAAGSGAVLAARARGASPPAIVFRHMLWPRRRALAALAAVSAPLAIGASVAVEAVTGTPGIGHLAWKATTSRDVVLLVGLTLVLTAVTLAVNTAAEVDG